MVNFIKTNYDLNNKETVSVIDELSLWAAPFGLKLLEKINYRRNITALDIGPGLGFPLLEVAMRLGRSSRVYGIDPWRAAIERINTKIKIYEIQNVKTILGVAESIPLADNSVDLIFSNNGLNNVLDISIVISECRRVSKEGAQLVFTYNTDKTMHEFYSVFEEILLEKNMLNEIGLMKEQIYKKRKPVEEFIELLNENGYGLNEILHDRFEYRFVDGSAMLNHFLITLSFIESWKSLIPENLQQELLEEVENRLNSSALKNGLLCMTVPYVLLNCEKTRG